MANTSPRQIPAEVPVVVVGGGPVGQLTALQLARNGIRVLLVERNGETTRWPKMDITNARSMELLRRMGGLDERLREIGVPQEYNFDVNFSTGLGPRGQLITKWDLPSPNAFREQIKANNDGSMPREPYQRCSQAVFEKWLQGVCQANPLIECHWGVRFESLVESADRVVSALVDTTTEEEWVVESGYVIGCDGAGSRVRKSLGITLTGGPAPMAMYLVHFATTDLPTLNVQGRNWHIFFTSGSILINQDELRTYTIHLPIPLDTDPATLDPITAIHTALGGSAGGFTCRVDKVLVTSVWRPNTVVADSYASSGGRVFIAGDAAHQNIPTGGYGMNTGVGDGYDLGWKVAAVLKGWGGAELLRAYEVERRPVAVRNVERAAQFMGVHREVVGWCDEAGTEVLLGNSAEGVALRERIRKHMAEYDGENKDFGVELGYRYNGSPVINPDEAPPADPGPAKEPPWTPRAYTPTTWPGGRAPHIFLADGETSILDLYGRDFTLVDFSPLGEGGKEFCAVAEGLGVPRTRVHLPTETHVRRVWEDREMVLVRPDGHVAWRSAPGAAGVEPLARSYVEDVLLVAVGKRVARHTREDAVAPVAAGEEDARVELVQDAPMEVPDVAKTGFTFTVGNVEQAEQHGHVALLAAFQK